VKYHRRAQLFVRGCTSIHMVGTVWVWVKKVEGLRGAGRSSVMEGEAKKRPRDCMCLFASKSCFNVWVHRSCFFSSRKTFFSFLFRRVGVARRSLHSNLE
jgi:hypothetical protein